MASVNTPPGVERALGPGMECGDVEFQRNRSFIIVYNLTLNSMVPIEEEAIRKSLRILQEKFPLLRMTVIEHEGVKYFKEKEKNDIDFEYRTDATDWQDVYEEMLNTCFDDARGPLWRAKLLKQSRNHSTSHPYASVLLISWHHCITDGNSNVRLCNRLMEILDSVLSGKSPDKAIETKILPPLEVLLPSRAYTWKEVSPHVKEMIDNEPRICSFLEAFPAPGDSAARTRFLHFDALDKELTTKLRKLAKSKGSTVHGAFTAAAKTAIYQAIKNNIQTESDSILIHVGHAINMRRFLSPENQDVYGNYMNDFGTDTTFTKTREHNFWQLANEITKELRKKSSPEEIIQRITTVDTLHNFQKHIEKARQNPICITDTGISNMGDINSLFSGVYNNFNVTWLSRSTSIHYFVFPFCYNITTFRDEMYISMDWCTDCVTEEQVKNIGENTIRILKCAVEN